MPTPDSPIPILPVLSLRDLQPGRRSSPRSPSVLDAGSLVFTDSGSSAIALALAYAGVGEGTEVLVPAYHCPTMVAPVRALGGIPVFFPIRRDTTVDVEALGDFVSSRTAAVLVPHFFGIEQPVQAVRALCDRHGIVLIEDCAHAFFGTAGDRPVGATGHYAIASTRKFFPGADGGCLISAGRELENGFPPRGPAAELKAWMDLVEEATHYDTLGPLRLALRPAAAWKRRLRRWGGRLSASPRAAESDSGADETTAGAPARRMSVASRFVFERADRRALVAARRANFAYLIDRFSTLSEARPLVRELGPSAVPYMVPLLVDDERVYPQLRREGLPVWRWDHSDPSCPVAGHYARHLLQLPCHQSLTAAQLRRLAESVVASVRAARA